MKGKYEKIKWLLLIPSIVLTYLIPCLFLLLFKSTELNINWLTCVLIPFVVLLLFCIGCSLLVFFLGLKENWDSQRLARDIMIVKLIQIPAYIGAFILGVFMLITVFTIPFVIVLAFLDYLSLCLTGLVSITSSVLGVKSNKLNLIEAIVLSILQLVFCADVVAAIILYIKQKRRIIIE